MNTPPGHPPRWTDAEFGEMSWHDCTIHALRLEQDGEYQSDLVLDLDFILEWICEPNKSIRFKIAPALLRFRGVADLRIHACLAFRQPMQIGKLEQVTANRWRIDLVTFGGETSHMEFEATDATQELTAVPDIADTQALSWQQREAMKSAPK